jgi:hypothetical protein
VRRQEIEVNAGKGRRSLSEIEAELVEQIHAGTANDTTTVGFEGLSLEIQDAFMSGHMHSVFKPRGGSSMSDFLTEDFYDGTKQPGELRGIKWVR